MVWGISKTTRFWGCGVLTCGGVSTPQKGGKGYNIESDDSIINELTGHHKVQSVQFESNQTKFCPLGSTSPPHSACARGGARMVILPQFCVNLIELCDIINNQSVLNAIEAVYCLGDTDLHIPYGGMGDPGTPLMDGGVELRWNGPNMIQLCLYK